MVFAEEGRTRDFGTLDERFGRHEKHEFLPRRYRATVIRSVRASLYADDDQGAWRLVRLD